MARIFYHIVRDPETTVDNFKSAQQLGKPLVNPAYWRKWREGLSVYDDRAYAMAQARRMRFLLGRYVVARRVPEDGSIEFAQMTKWSSHPLHWSSRRGGRASPGGASSAEPGPSGPGNAAGRHARFLPRISWLDHLVVHPATGWPKGTVAPTGVRGARAPRAPTGAQPHLGKALAGQSTKGPHHYTIYATTDRVLPLVKGTPMLVPEEG